MKKFTQYITENIDSEAEDKQLDYIMDFFEIQESEFKLESVNQYLANRNLEADDLIMLLDGYEELLKEDNITNENLNTDERYKSDEQIEATYEEFEVEEFKFEDRDMSYMYKNGVFEGMVAWKFNSSKEEDEDLTEGGYSTSVEDFMYATEPNEDGDYVYKYAINNWYPETVYNKMTDIIEAKLMEKYGHDYDRGGLDHI